MAEGGALYILDATAVLDACKIQACTVSTISGQAYGGAVSVRGAGGTLTLRGTIITDCHATMGAIASTKTSPTVVHSIDPRSPSTVTRGTVTGGAIFADGGSVILGGSTVSDCTAVFIGDGAAQWLNYSAGGAIYCDTWVGGSDRMGMLCLIDTHISACRAAMKATVMGGALGAIQYSVIISNTVISGCVADSASLRTRSAIGGGIYLWNSTARVRDLSITNCTTLASGGQTAFGGAIYISICWSVDMSRIAVLSCAAVSSGSREAEGGAIRISNSTVGLSDVNITRCVTRSASGYARGGAIMGTHSTVLSASGMIIDSCAAFSATYHAFGGAVGFRGPTGRADLRGVTMTNCTASSTSQTASGGALYLFSETSTVVLSSTTIEGCTASAERRDAYGGAIRVWAGSLELSFATITNCTAITEGGSACGGALYVHEGGNITLTHASVSNCLARSTTNLAHGGAIYIWSGNVQLSDTTLENSLAESTSSAGGAGGGLIYASGGRVTLTNGARLRNGDVRAPASATAGDDPSGGRLAYLTGTSSLKAGSITYILPAERGYWLPATLCQKSTEACDWQKWPNLRGRYIHSPPAGAIDFAEYPFACPAGTYAKDTQTASQVDSNCSGLCPAGHYCPSLATTTPALCSPGHYCEWGASSEVMCPVGTYQPTGGGPLASCAPLGTMRAQLAQ